MTDEERGKAIAKQSVNLAPGFLTVLMVFIILTGNCSTCGFDKDYLGAWSGATTPAEEQ